MSSPRGWSGYLALLISAIVVPLLWLRALRFARAVESHDARARVKVLVGIGVSVALFAVFMMGALAFVGAAKDGVHDSFSGRIETAVGETAYRDQQSIIETKSKSIPIIEANQAATAAALQENRSAGASGADNVTKLRSDWSKLNGTLANTTKDLNNARLAILGDVEKGTQGLAVNHEFYLASIRGPLAAGNDQAVLDAISSTHVTFTDAENRDMQTLAKNAAAIQDKALADMQTMMWFMVYPSIAGLLYGPLAMVMTHLLRKTYVPSDTVGFKPYPGHAGGLFLLLGAFGVPSIPFAAWLFKDILNRQAEGQIAL